MSLVSIKEASRLLGVSEATLRSWSNEGQVKAFVTPGGHRRYHLEELKHLTSTRNRLPGLRDLTREFTQTPVFHRELNQSAASHSWYRELKPAQMQELMALGQGMFNLMLKYLTVPSRRSETTALARIKGEEFGSAVSAIGLSLTDSVEAFIQHRGHVMHFLSHVLSKRGTPGHRAAEALNLITQLMDEALIAMVNAHQRLSRKVISLEK
jgi:excisionase family DNA binding protein